MQQSASNFTFSTKLMGGGGGERVLLYRKDMRRQKHAGMNHIQYQQHMH